MTFLSQKAATIRRSALAAMHKAKIGHTADGLSVVEILVSLYYGEVLGEKVLNFNPKNPGNPEKDFLFLSNPNVIAVLYSLLADLDFFAKSDLDFLSDINSQLSPFSWAKVPGVNFSGFNLGEALGVAVGVALDLRRENQKNHCYCVLSDQELQIGSIWEAATTAAHYNLDNLTVFVDNNRIQNSGSVISVQDVKSVQDRFEACGWKVFQVTDGHNFEQILESVERSQTVGRRPVCIWCRTISSKGLPFAEKKSGFNKFLTEQEFENAQKILK